MSADCEHQYSPELSFPCDCGKTKTYRRHCLKCWVYEKKVEDGEWQADPEWDKAVKAMRDFLAPAGGR